MHRRRHRRRVAAPAAGLLMLFALAGCAPTLDWREARPQGSGVAMMFPCRPDRQERTAQVETSTLRLQLHSCRAGGATFSLAAADGAEPAQVTSLLAALRSQALTKLSGSATAEPLPAIVGATPNEQSALVRIVGRRADGRRVVAHAAFFVKGVRLYQAMVLDADDAVGSEAIETFFTSIRLL
jgi:hypothetical protein